VSQSNRRTALHPDHLAAGARLVDFGGWEMPLHYGSQIEEHHAVRRDAGKFDVSHMRVVDLAGAGSRGLLRRLLSVDVDRCVPGRAVYGCMLNERGGIVDDLIVYRPADGEPSFRAVLNAGTADSDLQWMQRIAQQDSTGEVGITSRDDLSILALQGPQAAAVLQMADAPLGAAAAELAPFACLQADGIFVGRTGYTGEDGFEIVVPGTQVRQWWRRLRQAGAAPCGLAARDTLRLEAGMCLYGQDLDDSVTPFESALAWTVDLNPGRAFVGREALLAQQARRLAGEGRSLFGLVLLERGVLRSHMPVTTSHGQGQTTSGTFSPTLQVAIALARLPAAVEPGDEVEVQMRGRAALARVVRPRFVRRGQALV
jgi:aminomethyltransferase